MFSSLLRRSISLIKCFHNNNTFLLRSGCPGSLKLSRCKLPQLLISNTIRRSLFTMKIDTPQFHNLFTPELKVLIDIFRRHSYELRIAGGAVRDLLMHKQPEDIDFATTATPEQMKTMFEEEGIRMINTKGEKHGTITARINDKQNFEITTLRIDLVTDGRHAEVLFTTDWQQDAARRDLTVNAMFLGLDGTLYDYFHGVDDLEKRVLRFVGEPARRIQEDYLRILRYFRFYGRLAVEPKNHDSATLQAIWENIGGLEKISGERKWSELKKILLGNHRREILETMLDLGIAPYIGLPTCYNISEFRRVCERALPLQPQPMTLLVALLNTEEEVLKMHGVLKLSGYERDLAIFIVNHREDKQCDNALRPYQALVFTTKGKISDTQEWICEVLKYRGDGILLDKFRVWQTPRFPVNGTLLMNRGIKGGRYMNKLLMQLKEYWIASDFTMTAEELLEKVPEAMENLK